MKLSRHLKLLMPVVALLALSIPSSASLLSPNATFGFVPFGTLVISPGTDLLAATSITLPALELVNTLPATAFGLANDFVGVFSLSDSVTLTPTTLSISSISTPLPNLISFTTAVANRFTFSATSEIIDISTPTRTVSLFFLGTFHDSVSGGFVDAPASLTFSFNQSAPNTAINGSGTFSTPPQTPPGGNTPEPATMGLFGSALVGLGLIGRKRFAL